MRRIPALLALIALAAPAHAATEEQLLLARARQQEAAAASRAARYEAASASATDAAEKSRAAAIALAARVQRSEARIVAAEARIAGIERLRAAQRRALAARQAPAARLAAALQTMARRPAALMLAQPGSTADMVHTRMLLASTLPAIRAQSASLQAEVDRGNRLRAEADRALGMLRGEQAALLANRQALARAEAEQRALSQRFDRSAMLQHERAQGMAEQAGDLVTLMGRLDADARRGAALAALPGPVPRPGTPGPAAAPPPPGPQGAPDWSLPLIGRVVTGTGEVSAAGVRAKGLTFAPAPHALAVAPAAGTVLFAGPFRGYGEIVAIDHGAGWTTLVTGLGRSSVATGAMLAKGSPIGTAPELRPRVTVELRQGGRTIDIARLAVRP